MIVIHSARGSSSEQIRIPNAVTQNDRENSKNRGLEGGREPTNNAGQLEGGGEIPQKEVEA